MVMLEVYDVPYLKLLWELCRFYLILKIRMYTLNKIEHVQSKKTFQIFVNDHPQCFQIFLYHKFQLHAKTFLIPVKTFSNSQSLYRKGFLLQYFLTKEREIRKLEVIHFGVVKLTFHTCLLYKQVILIHQTLGPSDQTASLVQPITGHIIGLVLLLDRPQTGQTH